jgi:hypothetical protein
VARFELTKTVEQGDVTMGIEYRPSHHLAGFDKLPRAERKKPEEEPVTPYTMGHVLQSNTEDTANPNTGQLTRYQKIALYQDYYGCVNPSDEQLAAFDPDNPPEKTQKPELLSPIGNAEEVIEEFKKKRELEMEKKAAEHRHELSFKVDEPKTESKTEPVKAIEVLKPERGARYLKPNTKLVDLNTSEGRKLDDNLVHGQLHSMGYRGVRHEHDPERGAYIELFHPNEDTYIHSQLKGIYNKAKGGT